MFFLFLTSLVEKNSKPLFISRILLGQALARFVVFAAKPDCTSTGIAIL